MTTTVAPATIKTRYREDFEESARLYERARVLFPSGVTHDARFMEPFPPYVTQAQGARKWTVEGRELIDYWVGHGSLLLGHGHSHIAPKVAEQAARGTHLGACHELEIEWAEWVTRLIPSAERVRFVNSGTEATLMALRLSRMFTRKSKVVKFFGHFHGWHDHVAPGSVPPFDVAEVPGVIEGVTDALTILPPNDLDVVERTLANGDVSCVIIEPTGGHFGIIHTGPEFLRELRELTAKHGVLLIFDEVISGFRVHPGGAQGLYGITPDMTTLAKILAGGLPGGALVGREDVMRLIEFGSDSKMPHPGTYNANPLSATAGIETLKLVADGKACDRANETGLKLRAGMQSALDERGINGCAYGEFSGFNVVFDYDGPRPGADDFVPYDGDYLRLYRTVDSRIVHGLRMAMLLGGVDFMGSRGMTCAAHTDEDIEHTAAAFGTAVGMMREEGLV